MVQNYFILTAAERLTAMGYNTPEFQIDPRAVDNASPGVGVNMNDQAANYALGASVPLVGTYVAPKRIVDNQDYVQNAPDMVAFLLTMPWASLDEETIFAPVIME
jgi:hypothetical protein